MAPSRAAKYEAWAQPVGRETRTVEAVCFAIGEVLQFFTRPAIRAEKPPAEPGCRTRRDFRGKTH
jgi:hypothetical protein